MPFFHGVICLILEEYMKSNRSTLFIIISSVALLIVLGIQVNWILETAQIKEELFNEKANMILSRTAETLSADEAACRRLDACADENDIQKIDSLIKNNMAFYNFHMEYSFEVKQSNDTTDKASQDHSKNSVYNKRLEEEVSSRGLELALILPEKKQFIIAEMGPMFITSVLLILIVIVLFWRTVRSHIKEKKISEHTTAFFNNMTHEFKTPLTNIALAGKMIRKNAAAERYEKIDHYSDIILEENEKLRIQVEQALNMTAFERGEIPLQKAVLSFHELIAESANCMSVQIESRQGELKLDLEANNDTIAGDKIHLANAFRNILDNALKYSSKKPKVAVSSSSENGHFTVSVSDKGIGIPKEYQKKIFDQFFRVPTGDIHDAKGFGLGLSYTKTVVELHGGSIELQSEKGKGTSFKLILPNG